MTSPVPLNQSWTHQNSGASAALPILDAQLICKARNWKDCLQPYCHSQGSTVSVFLPRIFLGIATYSDPTSQFTEGSGDYITLPFQSCSACASVESVQRALHFNLSEHTTSRSSVVSRLSLFYILDGSCFLWQSSPFVLKI